MLYPHYSIIGPLKAFVVLYYALGFTLGTALAASDNCLVCHADKPLSEKTIGIVLNAKDFLASRHSAQGCQGCHLGLPAKHPASAAKARLRACLECHSSVHAEFMKTKHASLKLQCTSCHDPHSALQKPLQTCYSCHKAEAQDYLNTAHASKADCLHCHSPHTPKENQQNTASTPQCQRCHSATSMATSHEKWLPQADLHLEIIGCTTCHSSSEKIRIELIARSPLPKDIVLGQTMSLQQLKQLSTDKLQLRVVPDQKTHRYGILQNRWDCTYCHSLTSSSEAFPEAHLLSPDADGKIIRTPIEKGALLDALYGTRDFYMMGTTRSPLLSWLGLAIVLGGVGFAGLHGSIRFLTRKNRKRKPHAH